MISDHILAQDNLSVKNLECRLCQISYLEANMMSFLLMFQNIRTVVTLCCTSILNHSCKNHVSPSLFLQTDILNYKVALLIKRNIFYHYEIDSTFILISFDCQQLYESMEALWYLSSFAILTVIPYYPLEAHLLFLLLFYILILR